MTLRLLDGFSYFKCDYTEYFSSQIFVFIRVYFQKRTARVQKRSILITKLLCKAVLLAIRKREFPFCRTLSGPEGGTNTVTKKCQCENWFVIIILTNTSSLTNKVGPIPVSYLYFLMENSSVHVTWLSVNWDFDFNRYLWTVYLLRVLSFVMFPPYNFLLVLCFIIWSWHFLTFRLLMMQSNLFWWDFLMQSNLDAVKSLFPFVLAFITFVVDIYYFCLLSIHSCFFGWWSISAW